MKLYTPEISRIPVSALLRHTMNPFTQTLWAGTDRPLRKENIQAYVENNHVETEVHNEFAKYSIGWHERRVAYFVQILQKNLLTDAVCLEMPIPSLGYYPNETMTDGYHRLAAYVYVNAALIPVSFSGGSFEFLQFVRRSCDTPFAVLFEEEFFEFHTDMCPKTGDINKSRAPNPVGAAIEEMLAVMQHPDVTLDDILRVATKHNKAEVNHGR